MGEIASLWVVVVMAISAEANWIRQIVVDPTGVYYILQQAGGIRRACL